MGKSEVIQFDQITGSEKADDLTTFFLENSGETYISHSEIIEGRAVSPIDWTDNVHGVVKNEFEEALEQTLFSQSNLFGAYLNDKLIGIMLIDFTNYRKGIAFISDIVIDSTMRNKGVAKEFTQWALEKLKSVNIKTVFAESNLNNHTAHSFLEKMNFSAISKVFITNLD